MEKLIEKYYSKLDRTSVNHVRSMMNEIDWSNRFIGIKGARGVGKTTLLLQFVLLKDIPQDKALYISLDDLYFTENKLVDLADAFVKRGGQYLLVDEVHRYPNWSVELKNIYDDHPDLHLIFTGSSLIHIERARGDLSRRAVVYELPGLSFREFLEFEDVGKFQPLSLEDVLNNHIVLSRKICNTIRPLAYFQSYLQYGYYPFYLENKAVYNHKLMETVNIALNMDLPAAYEIQYSSIEKIKFLLHILSESVPFKPNVSKLSERIGVSRNSLLEYFSYLEEMRIVPRLYSQTKGISRLKKPEKLYLYHPNLAYALAQNQIDTGSIRESFFLSQLSVNHNVCYANQGDFRVGDHTFEVGGRSKSNKQIQEIKNAYIAADDIQIGHNNKIPLWLFGFLY